VCLDTELRKILPGISTDYSPLEALSTYQQRAESLTTLFYAVGGPMVILALLFISLTANIAVQAYEQETATMRGRGTSWWQVVLLNLIESVILILGAIHLRRLVGGDDFKTLYSCTTDRRASRTLMAGWRVDRPRALYARTGRLTYDHREGKTGSKPQRSKAHLAALLPGFSFTSSRGLCLPDDERAGKVE
jgi:hypothetical protein